ncbi:hypothetical protein [Pedobacter fastidiosus]|uniref:hypothetical protein n=1 Tax=Pedobacter fastidiosus TaxID=2765361 RepID=UPI001C9ABF81|nr:hypothetical protein [Pedobacter fastidiosus]
MFTIVSAYHFYEHVSNEARYEIINEIGKDNGFYWNKICIYYDEIEIFEDNCSSFPFVDKISVYCQKLIQKINSLEDNKIKYYSRKTKSFHKAEIIKNCHQAYDMIYRISYPIVSADKKTVLIKITQDCNCMLGGQGGTYIFKKIKGTWKVVDSYNSWIG